MSDPIGRCSRLSRLGSVLCARQVWPALALVLASPGVLSAQARNLALQGSLDLSPPPPQQKFEISDLWVQGAFAYVGDLLGHQISIVDVTLPSSPTLVCAFDAGEEIEDVVASGQYLYAARQPGGVRVYDLVNPAAPTCPPLFLQDVTGVPGAHNLFIHEPASGPRLMFVAGLLPARAVHVLSLADPSSPLLIGTFTQPAGIRYCDPGTDFLCGPHDVFAQTIGAQERLFVAALHDGVYILDVTNPASPILAAHFGWTFTTPDLDGDTVPDGVDLDGDGDTTEPGENNPSYANVAHDARATPDGRFLFTADEWRGGGHVKVWDAGEVLATCGAAPGLSCSIDQIAPVAEHRVVSLEPGTSVAAARHRSPGPVEGQLRLRVLVRGGRPRPRHLGPLRERSACAAGGRFLRHARAE